MRNCWCKKFGVTKCAIFGVKNAKNFGVKNYPPSSADGCPD